MAHIVVDVTVVSWAGSNEVTRGVSVFRVILFSASSPGRYLPTGIVSLLDLD